MKKLFWASLSLLLLFSCVSKVDESDIAIEFYNVGNAFFDLEKYDKAEEYYLRTISIDSEFHKARYNLVYIYVYKENFKEALKHINYLKAASRDNLMVKKLLAYVYYSSGKLEEALSTYLEILSLGDNSREIQFNIAKLYYQLEDYENSFLYVKDLLLEKADLDNYLLSGLISEKAEDYKAAVGFYESGLLLSKGNSELLNNLLDLYIKLGDFENQKRVLLLVVENSKDDEKSNALFELSKLSLITDNDFSKGYEYLVSAIDAGFKNEIKANELLETPDLIEVEKIRLLFNESEILK